MTKAGTTRVCIEQGSPAPEGGTNWARVRALTDAEVTAAALSDPDAQPMKSKELARMRRPTDER